MSDQPQGPRVQMKMDFKTKHRGRKVLTPRQDVDSAQAPHVHVSRQAQLLALAHRWQHLIDEGQVESQAEIADLMQLSTARVSQILKLARLAPLQQEALVGVDCTPQKDRTRA